MFGAKLRRNLILFHRWVGVAFSLLFALWFTSGIFMMYSSFPAPTNRLERAASLDPTYIRFSPQELLSKIGRPQPPNRVVLSTFAGRPLYRFYFGLRPLGVFADNAELLADAPPGFATKVAAQWVGQPVTAAKLVGFIREPDQWTVNGIFNYHGPLIKYKFDNGEEVYISTQTAEVVQHTTRRSRILAYFGAIPHWLYFTPLRKDGALWSKIVVWSSGIGFVSALAGLLIAIWAYSPLRNYRLSDGSSSLPYTGAKRWHAILGLIFGLVTCTWALSGMLSMEPFPSLSSSESNPVDPQGALKADELPMVDFLAEDPHDVISRTMPQLKVKELELVSFGGYPYFLLTESRDRSLVVPPQGPASAQFNQHEMVELFATTSEPYKIEETRQIDRYDAYYLSRTGDLPLPVLYIRLNDPNHSSYYIDPRTAEIVQGYTSTTRWNRWLYHGLHSLDFPWLYRYRPAWDLVVLALLIGGISLSVTSVLLAWRVVKSWFRRVPQRA